MLENFSTHQKDRGTKQMIKSLALGVKVIYQFETWVPKVLMCLPNFIIHFGLVTNKSNRT